MLVNPVEPQAMMAGFGGNPVAAGVNSSLGENTLLAQMAGMEIKQQVNPLLSLSLSPSLSLSLLTASLCLSVSLALARSLSVSLALSRALSRALSLSVCRFSTGVAD